MKQSSNGKRPRVAVTHDHGYNVDAYLEAVEWAGGKGIPVTPESMASMQDFDALLVSGGVDVDPALYGQERALGTEAPDPDRDRLEKDMLNQALGLNKPVLAICRGLQLFNVVHGGTLQQHIEQHRQPPGDKSKSFHSVNVEPGTRLADALGMVKIPVNSRHHQAVDAVGAGITVTAVAEDGTVEGLERTDRDFAVAVQWHPENMAASDPVQLRLFEAFIAAVRAAES